MQKNANHFNFCNVYKQQENYLYYLCLFFFSPERQLQPFFKKTAAGSILNAICP